MALPDPVDTLRDELACPQCGAEWNGMVCTACGFELPPEGLGDPNVDPFGVMMPVGPPGEEGDEGDGEESGDTEEDGPPQDKSSDSDKSKSDDSEKKDSDKKGPPKSDKSDSKADKKEKKEDKSDSAKSKDNGKSTKDKPKEKKGMKEELNVSRFDEFTKQATLPVDPPYRQDTSPAQSVPPYGQAIPGGTPVEGFEPALEPAPAAPAEVRDLDAPDVQGPVGQSMVQVVNQPAGPTDAPPPGSQVGEMLNSQSQGQEPVGGADFSGLPSAAASVDSKKVAFFKARAEALRAKADEFEKKADAVYQTDVRNLDEPPPVNLGPDATTDLLKAVDQHEQLLLADTPDVINDGSETGLPAGPSFRDRLREQVNPFNDAALAPYGQPAGIPWGASEVAAERAVTGAVEVEAAKCKAGCECPDGSCNCGSCSADSSKTAAAEEVARQAREEQRIAAAKTRVLRIANFVDERINMGLTNSAEKYADIARFEEMEDAQLDGYIQATREFRAKEGRLANKRIRVSASEDKTSTVRLPALGSVSVPAVVEDEDPASDWLTFLPN